MLLGETVPLPPPPKLSNEALGELEPIPCKMGVGVSASTVEVGRRGEGVFPNIPRDAEGTSGVDE